MGEPGGSISDILYIFAVAAEHLLGNTDEVEGWIVGRRDMLRFVFILDSCSLWCQLIVLSRLDFPEVFIYRPISVSLGSC